MRKKYINILLSLLFSLFSFSRYWRNLDDAYSDVNLLWGALVTVILVVFLYLILEKGIKRFSVAWGLSISAALGLTSVGVIWSALSESDILIAWGQYMWFFGFWLLCWLFVATFQGHKHYEWSFFKRARPIEDADNTAETTSDGMMSPTDRPERTVGQDAD